ncbi:hypothetical protein [Micromonospora sp. NPDC126480]|uniref:hypothetical protein n=1 Tax=Micromonospora sp. NPDC126480 TaxID=3155312 RepID=UPI003316BA5D
MAGDRTGPARLRRVPPLLRVVLAWLLLSPLSAGVRLLFGRDEFRVESVLGGALVALVWLPAWFLVPLWLEPRVQKWHPPYGAGPVQDAARREREEIGRRRADERALGRALRTGEPPGAERLRHELPAYLAWRRRGAALALAVGLPVLAALALLGWYGGSRSWSVVYGLLALPLAVWAGWVVVQARRLEPRR